MAQTHILYAWSMIALLLEILVERHFIISDSQENSFLRNHCVTKQPLFSSFILDSVKIKSRAES